MQFELSKSLEILKQTPIVLDHMLSGLSQAWLHHNEGPDTWSPYDIIGHLIHGEQTDWITRTKIILSEAENKTFEPFDRFAQMNQDQSIPVQELLNQFAQLRLENLAYLNSLELSESDLDTEGIHPDLGTCTLRQLLATWTVHDLGHIAQISRVMAKQYTGAVGPWKAYLRILNL